MKKSELIRLLYSSDEEEVFVEIDGVFHDIDSEVIHEPESFDGFFLAFPASIGLKLKD